MTGWPITDLVINKILPQYHGGTGIKDKIYLLKLKVLQKGVIKESHHEEGELISPNGSCRMISNKKKESKCT